MTSDNTKQALGVKANSYDTRTGSSDTRTGSSDNKNGSLPQSKYRLESYFNGIYKFCDITSKEIDRCISIKSQDNSSLFRPIMNDRALRMRNTFDDSTQFIMAMRDRDPDPVALQNNIDAWIAFKKSFTYESHELVSILLVSIDALLLVLSRITPSGSFLLAGKYLLQASKADFVTGLLVYGDSVRNINKMSYESLFDLLLIILKFVLTSIVFFVQIAAAISAISLAALPMSLQVITGISAIVLSVWVFGDLFAEYFAYNDNYGRLGNVIKQNYNDLNLDTKGLTLLA